MLSWTEGAGRLRQVALRDAAVAKLPPLRREAAVYGYVLERLPRGIAPGSRIVGEVGWQWADSADIERLLSDTDKPTSLHDRPESHTPVRRAMLERFDIQARYTPAHTCINFRTVLLRGLAGILEDVAACRSEAPADKGSFYDAVRQALNAVIAFAESIADLCDGDSSERCRRVPRGPACSLHDALQSMWLVHVAVGLSDLSGASLSFGRFDKYLEPFYTEDLRRGVKPAELDALLDEFFVKVGHFGDAACAVNIGPISRQEDLTEFDRAILRTVRVGQRAAPLLAVRISPKTPPEDLDELLHPDYLRIGQPTFYNEPACHATLLRRGTPEQDAAQWAVNSCMGLLVPGHEIADMWGVVFNLLIPLEMATNSGMPYRSELPMDLPIQQADPIGSFDELTALYRRYLDALLARVIRWHRQDNAWVARQRPNPLLSALIGDCIKRGLDRADGGARYHLVNVDGFGIVNAADALFAINELVFVKRRYALEELVEAARADWAGFESLRQEVLAQPKFGNGCRAVDEMTRDVADWFAASVKCHNTDHLLYAPSFHTLTRHVQAGMKTAASLDGRRAGHGLAKNVGTSPGRARSGHTALVTSVAAIDQTAFPGGQALDLSVDAAQLATPQGRCALASLVLTYFRLGGLQVQLNAVDVALMEQAMNAPEQHRDILVRIAGYSAPFTALSRPVQEEMIQRRREGM